jgi:putative endonuclease
MPSSENNRAKDRDKTANTRNKNEPNRVHRGRSFEDRAAEYYLGLGFDILDRNWQAGHKEIDLIVRQGDTVAFVEVKAGYSGEFGHPVERVTRKKIRNLTRAAQTYMSAKDIDGCDVRFDVVTFFQGKLEHYPNAFEALP